jgi:hypothetical protein
MRQRNGRTLPFVFGKESDAIPAIKDRIPLGTVVHADEARGWDTLHAFYDMRRINHSIAFSKDGASTNQAESYFSRLRRAEIGVHHHVSGRYLHRYASEMAWREDHRRIPNGTQYSVIAALALGIRTAAIGGAIGNGAHDEKRARPKRPDREARRDRRQD